MDRFGAYNLLLSHQSPSYYSITLHTIYDYYTKPVNGQGCWSSVDVGDNNEDGCLYVNLWFISQTELPFLEMCFCFLRGIGVISFGDLCSHNRVVFLDIRFLLAQGNLSYFIW